MSDVIWQSDELRSLRAMRDRLLTWRSELTAALDDTDLPRYRRLIQDIDEIIGDVRQATPGVTDDPAQQ